VPVDPTPALNRLVAVLQGIAGIQHVYLGAPESLDSLVNVYVTLDRWQLRDVAIGGLLSHDIDVAITFGYAVAGAEQTVEADLGTKIGATITALLAERRTRLNGTVNQMGLPDFSRASEPQYAAIAGSEFRLYPGIVAITLQETY
jgi:hypothetical protein